MTSLLLPSLLCVPAPDPGRAPCNPLRLSFGCPSLVGQPSPGVEQAVEVRVIGEPKTTHGSTSPCYGPPFPNPRRYSLAVKSLPALASAHPLMRWCPLSTKPGVSRKTGGFQDFEIGREDALEAAAHLRACAQAASSTASAADVGFENSIASSSIGPCLSRSRSRA